MQPEYFYQCLSHAGIDFYTGVPDSLLKPFCGYMSENIAAEKHVIAANEGGSVAIAVGYYLASGQVPLVYLQNSGLGNTINPLMSIVDPEVYGVPMVLLIGWRGEPNVADEPQHVKQGRVMLSTLESMEIPYSIIDSDEMGAAEAVKRAVLIAKEKSCAYALVVRKGAFSEYGFEGAEKADLPMSREQAIAAIVSQLDADDIIVSTTGMASRELFEYREAHGVDHDRDFLTIGGMGHASQIALGIALAKPRRRVICIDGDGAALMHLGGMAISGSSGLSNFYHIVINNGVHDSVGGQPTVAFDINLPLIAEGCCYKKIESISDEPFLSEALPDWLRGAGPSLMEVRVHKGARKDLGRPTVSPQSNKSAFMDFIRG